MKCIIRYYKNRLEKQNKIMIKFDELNLIYIKETFENRQNKINLN